MGAKSWVGLYAALQGLKKKNETLNVYISFPSFSLTQINKIMPFGFAAKLCKEWARISLWSFFSDVRIEGYEEATTEDQPCIL